MAVELARDLGIAWILVDSSPLMTAVYSLEYFDDDSLCAQALAHQFRYGLSLVMDDAIDWSAGDWQRDSPSRRASCQRRLLALLRSAGPQFHTIAGSAGNRLTSAQTLIAAIGEA